jgi:hypothetical protein
MRNKTTEEFLFFPRSMFLTLIVLSGPPLAVTLFPLHCFLILSVCLTLMLVSGKILSGFEPLIAFR